MKEYEKSDKLQIEIEIGEVFTNKDELLKSQYKELFPSSDEEVPAIPYDLNYEFSKYLKYFRNNIAIINEDFFEANPQSIRNGYRALGKIWLHNMVVNKLSDFDILYQMQGRSIYKKVEYLNTISELDLPRCIRYHNNLLIVEAAFQPINTNELELIGFFKFYLYNEFTPEYSFNELLEEEKLDGVAKPMEFFYQFRIQEEEDEERLSCPILRSIEELEMSQSEEEEMERIRGVIHEEIQEINSLDQLEKENFLIKKNEEIMQIKQEPSIQENNNTFVQEEENDFLENTIVEEEKKSFEEEEEKTQVVQQQSNEEIEQAPQVQMIQEKEILIREEEEADLEKQLPIIQEKEQLDEQVEEVEQVEEIVEESSTFQQVQQVEQVQEEEEEKVESIVQESISKDIEEKSESKPTLINESIEQEEGEKPPKESKKRKERSKSANKEQEELGEQTIAKERVRRNTILVENYKKIERRVY